MCSVVVRSDVPGHRQIFLFVWRDALDGLKLPSQALFSLSLFLAFLENPLNKKEHVLLKKIHRIGIFLKSIIGA